MHYGWPLENPGDSYASDVGLLLAMTCSGRGFFITMTLHFKYREPVCKTHADSFHSYYISSSARSWKSDSRGFFLEEIFLACSTALAACSMGSRVPAPAMQPPGQAMPSSR